MSLFATLKRNAKHALKNNWGSAIVVSFIPVLTSMILSIFYLAVSQVGFTNFNVGAFIYYPPAEVWGIVSSRPYEILSLFLVYFVLVLLTILLLIPLSMGVTYWFYHLVEGTPKPISGVFHFFESGRQYGRAFWLQFSIGVRRFFWGILFFVLPTGLFIGGYYLAFWLETQSAQGTNLGILFVMSATLLSLLSILGSALYTAYMNKYFLAPYYLVAEEDLKVGPGIKKSIEHTKGYRFNLLWFMLSFIGWLILSCIPFMVFYTLPYISASMALYASYLMETKKREAPMLQKGAPSVEEEVDTRGIALPPQEARKSEDMTASEPQWGPESGREEDNLKKTFATALREGQTEPYLPPALAADKQDASPPDTVISPPVVKEIFPPAITASPSVDREWVSGVLPSSEGSTKSFPPAITASPSADEEWVSAVLPPNEGRPSFPLGKEEAKTSPLVQPHGPVLEKGETEEGK